MKPRVASDFDKDLAIQIGQRVLAEEAKAIARCADRLDSSFAEAANLLCSSSGRVVTCGLGKSGHIARKMAATLSSTGTPSLFVHAAEAVHGDLGMIQPGDVVLVYTHSGETHEVVQLFPAWRAHGVKTILMTGRPNSTSGRLADVTLNTGVIQEAGAHNLAPTTSTTVMLALSDALAMAVMEIRGFLPEHFARLHPSGSLGKRLLLTVSDVMKSLPEIAVGDRDLPLHKLLQIITQAGVGAAVITDSAGRMEGFVSDGDVRRHILLHPDRLDAPASELMTVGVSTIEPTLLATEALEVFQNLPRKIGEMPVVLDGEVLGLLMLKDLLRSGII